MIIPDIITRDFVTDEIIDYTIVPLKNKDKNEYNIILFLYFIIYLKYI